MGPRTTISVASGSAIPYSSAMRRAFLLLSLLSLLPLAACGGNAIEVKNNNGKVIGVIEMQGTKSATITNGHGEVRGKVRGAIIRDSSGKHIGTIADRDGHTVILDGKDNPVGSLDHSTDCYGKSQEKLGTVAPDTDSSAAAAACLVFFLQ